MVESDPTQNMLPACALGCLAEEETIQVIEHVEGCETCRAELLHYEAIAAQLPLALVETEPPARLKARLLRQAALDAPAHAGRAAGAPGWLARAAQALRRNSPVWALTSLVLLLVVLAGSFVLWRQTAGRQPTTVLPTINLQGAAAAPEAIGLLVVSADGEHGTLVVDRLPALDEDQQYQLWLIREDGGRASGAVFSVSAEGYGSVWVEAPEPLINYPAFGVTIEPAGGSPGPTGPKVLGG